jgi:hypothetical protein
MDGPLGDYTVYTRNDLTIRRGEKALITILRQKIRYSHVYRWGPPAQIEHFLTLHNSTDTAWTTGPILAVSNDQPLCEDLLKYTPKGASAEIPVTTAINVSHDRTEKEVERTLKAHSPREKVWYDLVTIKGELKLANFEKRPVTVFIACPTAGKPTEASDDGVMGGDTDKLQLLDRAGTIQWKVTLDPGKSTMLTYKYEKYVSE